MKIVRMWAILATLIASLFIAALLPRSAQAAFTARAYCSAQVGQTMYYSQVFVPPADASDPADVCAKYIEFVEQQTGQESDHQIRYDTSADPGVSNIDDHRQEAMAQMRSYGIAVAELRWPDVNPSVADARATPQEAHGQAATACLSYDVAGGVGRIHNNCSYDIVASFCWAHPEAGGFVAGFDCDAAQFGGSLTIPPGGFSGINNSSTGQLHYAACARPAVMTGLRWNGAHIQFQCQ